MLLELRSKSLVTFWKIVTEPRLWTRLGKCCYTKIGCYISHKFMINKAGLNDEHVYPITFLVCLKQSSKTICRCCMLDKMSNLSGMSRCIIILRQTKPRFSMLFK